MISILARQQLNRLKIYAQHMEMVLYRYAHVNGGLQSFGLEMKISKLNLIKDDHLIFRTRMCSRCWILSCEQLRGRLLRSWATITRQSRFIFTKWTKFT